MPLASGLGACKAPHNGAQHELPSGLVHPLAHLWWTVIRSWASMQKWVTCRQWLEHSFAEMGCLHFSFSGFYNKCCRMCTEVWHGLTDVSLSQGRLALQRLLFHFVEETYSPSWPSSWTKNHIFSIFFSNPRWKMDEICQDTKGLGSCKLCHCPHMPP